MSHREWLYALVLCGCRWRFDDTPTDRDGAVELDAPACVPATQHDDDGDGIADDCDVCPDVDDAAQLDADSDGIGDACDPSTTTREQRTLFDPFTTFDARWSGNWTPGVDQLETDARGSSRPLILMTDHTTRTFAFSGTVLATGTTGKQIAIQFDPTVGPRYYCELFGVTTQELKLRSTDAGPDHARLVIDATTYPTGTFRIALRQEGTELVCELTFDGTPYQVRAAAPTIVPSGRIYLNAVDVQLTVDMFSELQTVP